MSTYIQKPGDNTVYKVCISVYKTSLNSGENNGTVKLFKKLSFIKNTFSTGFAEQHLVFTALLQRVIDFSTYKHP